MNEVDVSVEVPITTLNQTQPTTTPADTFETTGTETHIQEDGILQTVQESFQNALESVNKSFADPKNAPGLLMLLLVILIIALILLAIIFRKQIKKLIANG